MADLIPYTIIMERIKDDIDFIVEQAYERGKRDILDQLQTTQTERKTGYIEIRVISMLDGEDCYCSECGANSLLPSDKFCRKCGVGFIGVRGEQDDSF